MQADLATELAGFISRYPKLTVLVGAGCSTASGIPDYRDDDGAWKNAQPVQYADFVRDEHTRKRYWARSYAGWERMSRAEPNPAHFALADLEQKGFVETLITQNVDSLHRKAGSINVIDLHGVLDHVRCLDCDAITSRHEHQRNLHRVNPEWREGASDIAPDGDAVLSRTDFSDFTIPECTACRGILKPDVVFFGESVPASRVRDARQSIEATDALLVVGSSLMVFSGFRFAKQAHALEKPVAIVNRGVTRADDIATLKLAADCTELLPRVAGYVSA